LRDLAGFARDQDFAGGKPVSRQAAEQAKTARTRAAFSKGFLPFSCRLVSSGNFPLKITSTADHRLSPQAHLL
jgi:hypothetical protein